MNKQKTILILLAVVSLAFVASAPVYAQRGQDDSNTSSGSSGSGSSQTTQTPTQPTRARISDDSNKTEQRHAAEVEMEHKAGQMVEQMRQEHGKKSPEERKKQCVAHQKGLNHKFTKIGTNVQRIQDKINKIYSNAQLYATQNKLNPTGYQDLIAKANDARTASQDSIDALKKVTPSSVDCTNPNVAQDVATFKAAAQDTRAKLKAYKAAVKDVLNALELPQGRANSGNLNPSSNSQNTSPTTNDGGTNQ